MPSLHAIAASLTLLLPLPLIGAAGQGDAPVRGTDAAGTTVGQTSDAAAAAGPQCNAQTIQNSSHSRVGSSLVPSQPVGVSPLTAFYDTQVVRQVRIEQRVTIRISPYRQANPNSLLARLPQRGQARTFTEREMSNCVPVSGIAGVQTGNGNRLLLFLRDQRIVSLNLERACRARDFYSGFYIERNEDGNLCVDRDELQSRSGAKCEVERMRQLIAVDE